MKIPKVLKKIEITFEALEDFQRGNDVFTDIELPDGNWFHLEKTINEKISQPSLGIYIADGPYIPKFTCRFWTKDKEFMSYWGLTTLKGLELSDFNNDEFKMEDAAKKLMEDDDVKSVEIIDISRDGENYHTYGLLIRKVINE